MLSVAARLFKLLHFQLSPLLPCSILLLVASCCYSCSFLQDNKQSVSIFEKVMNEVSWVELHWIKAVP